MQGVFVDVDGAKVLGTAAGLVGLELAVVEIKVFVLPLVAEEAGGGTFAHPAGVVGQALFRVATCAGCSGRCGGSSNRGLSFVDRRNGGYKGWLAAAAKASG